MADPTSDTPNTPEDIRPRATIKLKPIILSAPATSAPAETGAAAPAAPSVEATPAAPAAAPAAPAAAPAAETAAPAEPAIHIAPSPAATVPGIKQTIRLRPPTAVPADAPASAEVKPAIKIVPKAAETPTGIPTAKPADPAPAVSPAPTIQLKKPESSTPTIQLKKPEPESSAAPAKKVGEAPVPPERKLTLKLKSQPSQQKELPKNIIPGLNIPNMPPQAAQQKPEEQPPVEAAPAQPPVAAPVETPTPVPEAVPDDKKKKGKLPKVKKQKAPVTSADEPNWFFLTLSCITLICVCFIAYLLFAQYMNMYEETQIPIPQFLMPPK